MNSHINHSIPGQVSSFINEEYPLFVEFLTAYYEWLESDGSPYKHLKNHLSYLDLQNSLDEYVVMLKKEYLQSVPEKVIADKEILLRYSKQFFQSLGTEKSFQFLFKIMFGESVEIYHPKVDVLRASDGKWIDDEVLMYVTNRGNVENFLYRTIKQTREVFPGVFETATATVNRIINRYANKFVFTEIYLTDVVGEFKISHPIEVDGAIEWIMPISGDISIEAGGANYLPDNVLTYTGDDTFIEEYVVTEDGLCDLRYNTLFTVDELNVKLNGVEFTDFSYDGKVIFSEQLDLGDIVSVTLPVYKGFMVAGTVSRTGAITSVKVIDVPFGIKSNQSIEGQQGGSGLIAELEPATSRKIAGYFFNDDGFLSSSKRLHDSDYYQDFSYVIRAGYDVEKYRDIVMRLLHPAGMKMFGEVSIVELIRLMIRDIDFTVEIKAIGATSQDIEVPLYSQVGFIEDFKYKFDPSEYQASSFDNVIVGDVVNNPTMAFNIHTSSITIFDPSAPDFRVMSRGFDVVSDGATVVSTGTV